jgi:hypothetical protein
MNQLEIIVPSNFDANKLAFEKKTSASGKVFINIKLRNSTKKLAFQLTKKSGKIFDGTGFGKEGKDKDDKEKNVASSSSDEKRWSLNGQYLDENDPEIGIIEDIDNFLIGELSKNSKEWYGKQLSKEIVGSMYGGINGGLLKHSTKGGARAVDANGKEYAPFISIKLGLGFKDNLPDFKFWKENTKEEYSTYDPVTKELLFGKEPFNGRFDIIPIVKLETISIMGKNFYPTFKLVGAKLFPKDSISGSITTDIFIVKDQEAGEETESGSETKSEEKKETEVENEAEAENEIETEFEEKVEEESVEEAVEEEKVEAAEEEVEEEVEEESEPEPEPVPVPVKKTKAVKAVVETPAPAPTTAPAKKKTVKA